MIDYITIMRKIILFINSAVTNERIDKHVNDAKKHLSKSQTVIYEIYKWAETLYLTVVGMFVIGYLIYTKKPTPIIDMLIAIAIFLIASLVISITFILITPNYVYQLNNNAIKEIELETASILPDKSISLEDIVSFNKYYNNEAVQHFECAMPNHFNVKPQYQKGNLYDLPVAKLLETANIKSTKNLLSNIQYLNKYYTNNYINDNRYDWINKQLNEFYNPTQPDVNNDILKNLKN